MKLRREFFLCIIIFTVHNSYSISLGFPSFSWGWGDAINFTKIVTSPDVVDRHTLDFPFKQCSYGMEGVMTKLLVFPCMGDNGRCYLNRGGNVTLDLEFFSNIPARALVGSLSAIFTRWISPLALGDPQDLCNSEHITCPIQPFVTYRFRTSIFIQHNFPMLSPDIKLLIKGDDGRDIACAIVPITIRGLERDSLPFDFHVEPGFSPMPTA